MLAGTNIDQEQQKQQKLFRQSDAYNNFLTKYAGDFSSISQLIRFMLCYLTNSAGPERNFSTMNWIKNKRRSSMGDKTLNDILHIRHNNTNIDQINLVRAMQDLKLKLNKKL